MKFYKDYHFYIAICAFIILLVGIFTDYFGVFVDIEAISTIISYLLSILIAFNVISINVDKDKNASDIKKDLEQTTKEFSEKINGNLNNQNENNQNKKIANGDNDNKKVLNNKNVSNPNEKQNVSQSLNKSKKQNEKKM